MSVSVISHKDISIKIFLYLLFFIICFLLTFNVKMWVLLLSRCIRILFSTADYSKDFSKTMVSTVSIAMNPVRSSQFQEEWTETKKSRRDQIFFPWKKRKKRGNRIFTVLSNQLIFVPRSQYYRIVRFIDYSFAKKSEIIQVVNMSRTHI